MNTPVKKFRDGTLSADIWANEYEGKIRYSITTQKVYRTEAGEWKTTPSLSHQDAIRMSALLTLAYEWVVQQ
jgi:hypothetical protein|tara:strand:- start:1040 stop:1255 length:216 start_codon:yes stop_codon:yes gene_type:complete